MRKRSHGPDSAEEDAVDIGVEERHKFFEGRHLRSRLEQAPPSVAPLPIHSPRTDRAHQRCLCDFQFDLGFSVLPPRPKLEDHHALAADTVAEVEVLAQVRRWTPSLDEGADDFLDLFFFAIGECHLA